MTNHRALLCPTLLLSALALLTPACATDDLKDSPEVNNSANNVRPSLDLGSSRQDQDTLDLGSQDQGDDQGQGQDQGVEDMGHQDQGDDQGQEIDMAQPADMAAQDMSSAQTCAQLINPNANSFQIDQSGVIPHYYARTAFDGQGVWVVYVRPESAQVRTQHVYAARFSCDGSVSIPSFKVNTDSGYKNYEPNIAIGDQSIFISYGKEVDGKQRLYVRVFDREGAPKDNTEHEVTPRGVDGLSAISDLVWESDLASLPNDQAIITASYYAQESGSFQIVAQRLNDQGQRVADALFPKKDKGVEQTRPSVATLIDGTTYISWSRTKPAQNGMPEEPMRVVYAKFDPNATQPDANGPFPAHPASTAVNELSRYSKERPQSGEVYLAFQTAQNQNILVKDGAFGAPLSLGEAGQSGRLDLRPAVAARIGGGALAWLRASGSPISNQLIAQGFNKNAQGQLTMGSAKTITTAQPVRPAGNYGVSISHISGTTYFLAWSEGASTSNAVLKGQFINLP